MVNVVNFHLQVLDLDKNSIVEESSAPLKSSVADNDDSSLLVDDVPPNDDSYLFVDDVSAVGIDLAEQTMSEGINEIENELLQLTCSKRYGKVKSKIIIAFSQSTVRPPYRGLPYSGYLLIVDRILMHKRVHYREV
jgi:hypothetical protein